jgi:hypothetical protein
MTTLPATRVPAHPYLRALAVLGRAATGLVLHGLRRPFAPAIIDPRTGRVAAR